MALPNINRGDTGDSVKICQERLTLHGYTCPADGQFGAGTETKVLQFQRSRGLGADGVVGQQTWTALLVTPSQFPEVLPPGPLPLPLQHMKSLGHKVYWKGDHHLTLFGYRNPKGKVNSFDDVLGAAYTEKGLWRCHYWPGTTDPGLFPLQTPSNPNGVAILVEDQYLDVWKLDLHGGKYEALCQRNGDVRVYRDKNKNSAMDADPATIQKGSFGINIHRSSLSGSSAQVDRWSEGCQVHALLAGFDEMMQLTHKQVEVTKIETFSYTLMKLPTQFL